MKLYLVSVFDVATETFARPFCVNHPAQATRSFSDEVNNPESEISKHASDYELWELGFFEDSTGELHGSRQRLVRASDLVKGV